MLKHTVAHMGGLPQRHMKGGYTFQVGGGGAQHGAENGGKWLLLLKTNEQIKQVKCKPGAHGCELALLTGVRMST